MQEQTTRISELEKLVSDLERQLQDAAAEKNRCLAVKDDEVNRQFVNLKEEKALLQKQREALAEGRDATELRKCVFICACFSHFYFLNGFGSKTAITKKKRNTSMLKNFLNQTQPRLLLLPNCNPLRCRTSSNYRGTSSREIFANGTTSTRTRQVN